MKVLYDHQMFLLQTYGGITRYFYELMSKYSEESDIKIEIALKYSNNYYMENAKFSNHKTFFKNKNFKGKNRFLNFTNVNNSIRYLKKGDYDLLHPTYYDPYFLEYISNKPFVLTIHDMIHEIYPHMFSKEDKTIENKKLLAQKAAKIIAISNNTKKDIIKFYGIDESKIEVIYHGNSLNPENYKDSGTIVLPKKYLLFVGARQGYKNFDNFIKAAAPILKQDNELEILCAGGGDFSAHEIELIDSLNIQSKVNQYSIDDASLVQFYKNALAFVYPSLYEGFGIPILEAFTCGCPLILSNSSCFPEIAGEAGVYFNPLEVSSIAKCIEKVIYDKDLRQALKQKGFEEVKRYSWDATAEETKKLYKSI